VQTFDPPIGPTFAMPGNADTVRITLADGTGLTLMGPFVLGDVIDAGGPVVSLEKCFGEAQPTPTPTPFDPPQFTINCDLTATITVAPDGWDVAVGDVVANGTILEHATTGQLFEVFAPRGEACDTSVVPPSPTPTPIIPGPPTPPPGYEIPPPVDYPEPPFETVTPPPFEHPRQPHPTPPAELPETGTEHGVLAVAAVALIAGGLMLTTARRWS